MQAIPGYPYINLGHRDCEVYMHISVISKFMFIFKIRILSVIWLLSHKEKNNVVL